VAAPTVPTRDRIMDATAELFRRHGYTGTGMKQVVESAAAPFGSLYHHFPGGKEQLGAEVVARAGRMYLELFEMIMDAAPDVVTGVEWFFAGAAETLRTTDYVDACPIETVALEVASTSEPLRVACHAVFESWLAGATDRFTAAGIEPATSRALAVAIVALLEGAFVLDRAARRTEALEVGGRVAAELVRAARPDG
jgi:AcrR family transcriptional regulator